MTEMLLITILMLLAYNFATKRRNTKLTDENQPEKESVSDEFEEKYYALHLEYSSLKNALNQKDVKDNLSALEEERIRRHEEVVNKKILLIDERFEEYSSLLKIKMDEIKSNLNSLESKEKAAIDARVREYEEANKERFYTIILEPEQVQEIEQLMEVVPRLRNRLPLLKAIYDTYYKKPIKDLTIRVVGEEKTSGIYKITYNKTGECYIGQSVDMANRWTQHCKRGFGVDGETTNKLYPAMKKYGIHNFKYEVIEVVSRDRLSEREKYWAKYFGAKRFGFTEKA